MKVIVSTELEDKFSNFIVVNTFRKVRELKGVTSLIIHKYNESDFDAGVFISEFYNSGISQFIYINKKPSATMKLVLEGVQGKIFCDEFYFEDEEELMYLLDDVAEEDSDSSELAVSNIQVVKGFVQSYIRGEERIKAPLYLEQVNQAIDELSNITEVRNTQLTTMGKSALSVFEKASKIITGMDEQRQKLEQQLRELEEISPKQSAPQFGGSILYFPSYKYIGTAKVLFIREVAPCRYLTSFILGYEHYLHYELNKRVKLIFVHQKGLGVSKKYDGFTAITQESMGMSSLYDSEIITTNNPKTNVWKEIFSKQCDVFIIVDRLYGNQDIVTGRISKLNAVGGISDLTRFKLTKGSCIFPVTEQDGCFFSIPTIRQYPSGQDVRYAAYGQLCKDKYEKLDEFLELPRI